MNWPESVLRSLITCTVQSENRKIKNVGLPFDLKSVTFLNRFNQTFRHVLFTYNLNFKRSLSEKTEIMRKLSFFAENLKDHYQLNNDGILAEANNKRKQNETSSILNENIGQLGRRFSCMNWKNGKKFLLLQNLLSTCSFLFCFVL